MRPIPPHAMHLADGRLHLQHGPIDLIIDAFGETAEIKRAHAAATRRFATVLDELCSELPALRQPAQRLGPIFCGAVARRMRAAVLPFCTDRFITPMAAVAGAVAEEILGAMQADASLDKAYVNNGGDIALHLGAGQSVSIGLVDQPDRPSLFATTVLGALDGVSGISTSGRHGRSFSLGIADAVTVLAGSAAEADAAATVIANAVDLQDHPAVRRRPAIDLDPQSDLGERQVTVGLGALKSAEIDAALAAGLAQAQHIVRRGLITGAALHLRGRTLTTSFTGFVPLVVPAVPSRSEVIHAGR